MRLPADPRVRFLLAALAALFAFWLVLVAVDRLSPAPKGPPGSSYATSPRGLAAYAAVLERAGQPVRRLRTPIAERRPRTAETLIVLDPDTVEPAEARAIAGWVRGGGRLVAGGTGEQPWLEEVLGEEGPVSMSGAPDEHAPLVPVTETAGVGEARSAEGLGYRRLGRQLPVLGPVDRPLVVTRALGRGSVALLADVSPLDNRGLTSADNAALGLALTHGRPVAFLETVHGYGVSRGFGGLPANVKWTLLGLGLTALVALWAAGRRFGPPEDPDTEPPPPRVEYVDALAAALVRAAPDKEDRS